MEGLSNKRPELVFDDRALVFCLLFKKLTGDIILDLNPNYNYLTSETKSYIKDSLSF